MMGYSAKSLEAIYANRKPLLTALTSLQVSEVIIRYEGGSDSGEVSDLCLLPENAVVSQQLTTEQIKYHCLAGEYREGEYHYHLEEQLMSLDAALRDFALTWVDAHHGGWENNEGGAGVITINVAEPKFQLEHIEYYTESTGYEHTL